MDKNYPDYRNAMRIGAYLMECVIQNVHHTNTPKASAAFMATYTRLMARATQSNAAQMSVDIRDEWNKTYGGKRKIEGAVT